MLWDNTVLVCRDNKNIHKNCFLSPILDKRNVEGFILVANEKDKGLYIILYTLRLITIP